MPYITVKTEIDGQEDSISEYMCDWADCPNIAVEVIGVSRSLRMRAVVCAEHAEIIRRRGN